jgi:hypothetical protein
MGEWATKARPQARARHSDRKDSIEWRGVDAVADDGRICFCR